MSMRVIECNACGEPLAAGTDDELARRLLAHATREHPSVELDETGANETIEAEA